ncbi:S24/S26 family peptidase [Frondihabitans cladoniiphilus]|uniref:Signal peptidase I n=1 Tax=Frondihabitans cladoniiphilus TaxID=715785 RepID=A0ABP8VKM6_9MICO
MTRSNAGDWTRLIVATVARGVLASILGLALWAAVPAVIGWHPTTVMTGSMEPRLVPGDVVVSRPVTAASLTVGRVLLFDDPDHPGELRLHRFVRTGPGGTLITKGDANRQDDSTRVARAAVRGVAFIRVPLAGLPVLWLREGRGMLVAGLVAGLAVVAFLTTIDRSLRRARPIASDAAPAELPRARHSGPHHLPPTRREIRRRARRARRLAHAGALGVLLLGLTAFSAVVPPAALAASFSTTTSNPTSTTAAAFAGTPTGLTCANNADTVSVTISWTSASSPGTTYDVLNGSTVIASSTTTSAVVTTSSVLGLGLLAFPLNVRADAAPVATNWTATSTTPVSVRISGIGTVSVRCA